MRFLNNDPIIANSTAISIIRISGIPFEKLKSFFTIKKIKARYAHYTNLVIDNEIIDRIILIYYPKPFSYTGEDLIELMVHGSKINIERIISSFKIRLATPGEFTYRALKNNKMTLTEVEGLDQVLNATSLVFLKSGMNALYGKLDLKYQDLYQCFLKLKMAIDVNIDFSEDVGERQAKDLINKAVIDFEKDLKWLYEIASKNIEDLTDLKIVILGEPNAGKSTLFNRLLNFDRAIIDPSPGTTRDYLTERIVLDGEFFTFVDTAGFRLADNEIEKKGILKSEYFLDHAFFKIWVQDVNHDLKIDPTKFDLVVYSHSDHSLNLNYYNLLTDDINDILNKVTEKYHSLKESEILTVARHRQIIKNTWNIFTKIDFTQKDLAILSQEVIIIEKELQELLGIIRPETVIDTIFENFCIGK